MYSAIATAAIHGIGSMIIQVETDVCSGMPEFEMVGILSSEVREAKARIRSAIRNTGFSLPPRKVTISLYPADVRKSGTGFDPGPTNPVTPLVFLTTYHVSSFITILIRT